MFQRNICVFHSIRRATTTVDEPDGNIADSGLAPSVAGITLSSCADFIIANIKHVTIREYNG
jgi:hypothetical protein